MNMFQILDWAGFSSIGINLINSSFALAGRLYGYMIKLATTTSSRTLNDYFSGLINSFYVIAGLFMLFRISISVFNYILDPDKISDSKAGPSKLLINIIITLIMIIAFKPNGVVYGFLTDVEDTFLYKNDGSSAVSTDSQGFMGRIFNQIGNQEENDKKDSEKDTKTETTDDDENLRANVHGLGGNELIFANSAAGAFYSCNITNENVKEEVYTKYQDSLSEYIKDSSSKSNQGLITRIVNNKIFKYNPSTAIQSIIVRKLTTLVETAGDNSELCYQFEVSPLTISRAGDLGQALVGKDQLDYYFFTGIIFSIILIIYMIVLCVEVIVRNLKLVLYQIIAPIPIINGIDPNDKMRSAWLKGYFGAYLDLFFKIFAIQLLARLMIIIPQLHKDVGVIGSFFFLVALLVFVKMVPNIISDVLGIKNLGGSFKEASGMLKKGLGLGAGAAIGGVVGAATAKGGLGAKVWGAARGGFQGGNSGRKGDIFKGSQNIAKTNAKENDLRDQKVGALKRMVSGFVGKTGMPSSYAKQKEDLDLKEVELQNREAQITDQKALLRNDEYKKSQISSGYDLIDSIKKGGGDDLVKNKPQHRNLLEVQAYNNLKRRLDAKEARGEELTEYEQSALSEAKKNAGDAIAEFDSKSAIYNDRDKFNRIGKKLVWNSDGSFKWEDEVQEVEAKRDIGVYNKMMAFNEVMQETGGTVIDLSNIDTFNLGTTKDNLQLEKGRLERDLTNRQRNITVQEEALGDDKQDLANKRRELENSKDKLIHDAYHNN